VIVALAARADANVRVAASETATVVVAERVNPAAIVAASPTVTVSAPAASPPPGGTGIDVAVKKSVWKLNGAFVTVPGMRAHTPTLPATWTSACESVVTSRCQVVGSVDPSSQIRPR
jgi:hypothetical protein